MQMSISTQFSATAKCVWHMVITISHMQIRKHQFLPLTNTKNLRPHPPPNISVERQVCQRQKKIGIGILYIICKKKVNISKGSITVKMRAFVS